MRRSSGPTPVSAALSRRNSQESYREYVRRLAADADVDISDPAAVARFDRTRAGRRPSNREWHHPDDPDALVGRTKSGACDMIERPEHIVDLESGAVVSAEIRHGDEADTAGLADRIAGVAGKVEVFMARNMMRVAPGCWHWRRSERPHARWPPEAERRCRGHGERTLNGDLRTCWRAVG
jgi:hypothetical protein